jgi:AcrR family transcriptional regulator
MAVNSRRAEHIQDTRAALLRAARRLFAEKGYAGTGTEEIVARARVTRGALYHHFGDKPGLFRAVMEAVAGELAQQLVTQELAHLTSDTDATWDQLRDGVQTFLDACTSSSDFQRIVLIDGPAVLGPGAWSDLVEQHGLGLLRTWLQLAIDDHQIDPLPVEPLARLLAALIGEASLYIGQAADPARARRETGATIDRILTGLRSEPASSASTPSAIRSSR